MTNYNNEEIEFSIHRSLTEEEEELLNQVTEEAHNEIPENPTDTLVDMSTVRFSSASWYNKVREKNITLAGLGGIGSYVGFLLSRLKPGSLYLYDDDKVEQANLSGQLYGMSDIGNYKVTALSKIMTNYSDFRGFFSVASRVTILTPPTNIMICGFDNMQARKDFYYVWRKEVMNNPEEKRKDFLFIDGRLAAEEFQVLCIRGDDEYNMKRYEREFLFSDSEAEETICSYKQTSYCATMIASYIVNLFVNFCTNQCSPVIDRDLPFFTSYDSSTMYLKTEH